MSRASTATSPPAVEGALEQVVHDLHGPLTVIRGLCASLSRDEARPERRRAIDLIDAEVLRLTAGLKVLGRTATPRPGEDAAPVDLAALVRGAEERFAAVAERAGVALAARGLGSQLWVRGTAALLERLIENLLRNAIRHCDRGGRVEIAVACRDDRAVLRIRDDGAGVPAADRDRIFQAGERGSRARGEGRGLGLAIAREIAEAHGGRLTLDAVGRGASFRLVLPITGPDPGPLAA